MAAAAAEARAAWQRAANCCLAQEDRKRAPKLACFPSAYEQQHEIRWWPQLQPNFGIQKDRISEFCQQKPEDTAPRPKHEKPLLLRETSGTDVDKSADLFEPTQTVSSSFTKYSSVRSFDELRTISDYSHVPLNCRGTALYEDGELLGFKCSDPPPSKNQQKANSDMDAPWKDSEKTQPWWQITDENELASLVAERAIHHIENCDLPRPTQTVHVHRTESHRHGSISHSGGPSSSPGRLSHPGCHGQCELINCNYNSGSTDEPGLSNNRVRRQHNRNYTYSPAQDFSNSGNTGSESKQTFPNALERDEILDALRHSQTRAREAEMAAKEASTEKDYVVNLLLREASHLFACNLWLKISQLENIGLQLKHKEDKIATVIPELPWMTPKEKPMPGQEQKDWSRKKGRRQKMRGGFFDAILFAIGLGLAGAGFLLGWTLGWLLPKL